MTNWQRDQGMLTDKRMERLIKLTYKLSMEEFVHRADLAGELNCSLRTVDATLNELQVEIEKGSTSMKIDFVNGQTMQLTGKDDAFLKRLLHHFYLQDDMIRFFLVAISKKISAKTFVDEQYMSRATFFRKLKQLNQWLAKYELAFNLRTLELQGDERHIRQFYFTTLLEITGKITWPFPFDREKIEHRLDAIVRGLSLQLSSTQKEAYLYLLAVQHYRTEQNHFSPEYDQAFPFTIRERLIGCCQSFLESFPAEYRKGEEDFLLMVVVNSPCLYHPSWILEENIQTHMDRKTHAWFITEKFTKALSSLFPDALNEGNLIHIKGHLLQLHCNYHYHSASYLSYKDLIYAKAIKKQHPLLMSIVDKLAKATTHTNVKTLSTIKTRYLLMLYTFIDINTFQPPMRLLILSSEGPVYEDTLSEKILGYVPFQLEISTSAIEHKKPKDRRPYSLILTDMPMVAHSNDNILYVHSPPTFHDWSRIYERCVSAYWNQPDYASFG